MLGINMPPLQGPAGPPVGRQEGEPEGVPFLRYPLLSRFKGLRHAVFTRHGGVSAPPYDTLNASRNTADEGENIKRNLMLIREALGVRRLVDVNQVHGGNILIIRAGGTATPEFPVDADAIVTDMPNRALMIRLADCQGVFLFDPVRRVAANVHCGWRGSLLNILGQTVRIMKRDFACMGHDIRAAIGPSLGPCCAEFVDHETLFPYDFRKFMVRENHFDFWAISRMQLEQEGIGPENIVDSGLCTRCRTDLFFSYRGEGETGRFAAVLMLTGD